MRIYVDKETMTEIEKLVEGDNPDALTFVTDQLRKVVHEWMLRNGGETLRSREMQQMAQDKVKEHINEQLPALRSRVVDVVIQNFRPQKW